MFLLRRLERIRFIQRATYRGQVTATAKRRSIYHLELDRIALVDLPHFRERVAVSATAKVEVTAAKMLMFRSDGLGA